MFLSREDAIRNFTNFIADVEKLYLYGNPYDRLLELRRLKNDALSLNLNYHLVNTEQDIYYEQLEKALQWIGRIEDTCISQITELCMYIPDPDDTELIIRFR